MSKPKIILITGQARHGKDSLADFLEIVSPSTTARMAFADGVKKVAKEKHDWDGEKNEVGRSLLQLVGTGYKILYGKDYWIKDLESKIEDDVDYIIVSDTRFINESTYFKENGYKQVVIRVIRLDEDENIFDNGLTEKQKNHPSEAEMSRIKSDIVISAKNLNELCQGAILHLTKIF